MSNGKRQLTRCSVTADMLEDSMVLAPKEAPLFNNREKFELVVVYDQNSTSFGQQDSPLSILVRTIFTQAFKKMLKKGPMILVGGIDAWKKDVGEAEVVKGEPSLSYVAPKPITPSTSMNGFGIAGSPSISANSSFTNAMTRSRSDTQPSSFDQLPASNHRPTYSVDQTPNHARYDSNFCISRSKPVLQNTC